MPDLSRSQLAVYAAIAVVLLLVGVRWIRSEGSAPAREPTGIELVSGSEGGGGGALVVHVAGSVRSPGVYRLPDGARVADAIERAGGATAAGAADAINLAARIADGQQVVVPARDSAAAGGSGPAPGEGPIPLGTATVEQLETIAGIGPVTAGKIVEFRDRNGGVGSIEELEQISGIGPATIEALRERLQP